MWRYGAGGIALLMMLVAGVVLFRARTAGDPLVPPMPLAAPGDNGPATPLPAVAPEASERTREEKRFDRYDKDRDDRITRDEYLAARRKAFARLDTNGDGALSFDEWAIKARTKFATADQDRSSVLTRAEFATTAVKRKPARRTPCPPAASPAGDD